MRPSRLGRALANRKPVPAAFDFLHAATPIRPCQPLRRRGAAFGSFPAPPVEPTLRLRFHSYANKKTATARVTVLSVWWRRRAYSAHPWASPSGLPCGVRRRSRRRSARRTRYAGSLPHPRKQTKRPPQGRPFCLFGGGGGNRTRVRKPSACRFYTRSLSMI